MAYRRLREAPAGYLSGLGVGVSRQREGRSLLYCPRSPSRGWMSDGRGFCRDLRSTHFLHPVPWPGTRLHRRAGRSQLPTPTELTSPQQRPVQAHREAPRPGSAFVSWGQPGSIIGGRSPTSRWLDGAANGKDCLWRVRVVVRGIHGKMYEMWYYGRILWMDWVARLTLPRGSLCVLPLPSKPHSGVRIGFFFTARTGFPDSSDSTSWQQSCGSASPWPR
jgi:hypothetical protein